MARYGASPFYYHVPPKEIEITERDQQAMHNFVKRSNVSLEAVAENYNCSAEYVEEVVNTRPWLRPNRHQNSTVNMTWWESDHSDSLELVKLFNPDQAQYLPDEAFEVSVSKKSNNMTWEEYYDSMVVQELYKEGGQGAVDAFHERTVEMAAEVGIALTFTFEKKRKKSA